MIRDSCEHLAQIGFGVQAVQLSRANETVDCRSALAAGIRPSEQVILST
jgi:hypothetical protein